MVASTFDFTATPDYSKENYLPGGIGENLHFVSRFLVIFQSHTNGGFVDLVALAYYTHSQHSMIYEEYLIKSHVRDGKVLYGFWAGFNQNGEFVISSSGSESMNIPGNKALEKAFLLDKRVENKLRLVMPHIKELGSVVFKRF